MKNSFRWIYPISTIILFAIIFELNFVIKRLNINSIATNNRISEINSNYLLMRNSYESSLHFNLLNEGICLDIGQELISNIREKVRFDEVLLREKYLVLFISQENCDVCVNEQLKIINDFSQIIGSENILIFGKYRSQREFLILLNTNNVLPKSFLVEDFLGINTLDLNMPFLFIVQKDFRLRSIYLIRNELLELEKFYLAKIIAPMFIEEFTGRSYQQCEPLKRISSDTFRLESLR
jgi:hypothetical protein